MTVVVKFSDMERFWSHKLAVAIILVEALLGISLYSRLPEKIVWHCSASTPDIFWSKEWILLHFPIVTIGAILFIEFGNRTSARGFCTLSERAREKFSAGLALFLFGFSLIPLIETLLPNPCTNDYRFGMALSLFLVLCAICLRHFPLLIASGDLKWKGDGNWPSPKPSNSIFLLLLSASAISLTLYLIGFYQALTPH